MPQPPSISPEQRQAALEKAGTVRRERAELKERLKMGSLTLGELFDEAGGNETIAKTKVLAVIESLPKVGKVAARRAMEDIGIAETRRVQGLNDRQRAELLAKFTGGR